MMTRTAKHVAWDKNMKKPQLGISLMTEPAFLEASFPLFAEGEIEILEWSFDTIQSIENEPIWLNDLLATYSNENKLIGHGVYYSLFDAHWGERQEIWINKIKKEVEKYKYNHISEHFGFMSSENYHKGVPLPIPLSDDTLNIGIDRLKRLQDAVNLPVGIENLAFSFSKKDVLEQGIFIEKMLDSVNGFLVLDLWNLLQFISIIWVLYEIFGFIFFQIFRFFIRIYKPSQPETLISTPKLEEKTIEINRPIS